MPAHISIEEAQQERSAKPTRDSPFERVAHLASRPLSRLRLHLRLRHGQDRALDFGLDPGILINGHMINADVAAEIDVRQLAAITGIGRDGRAAVTGAPQPRAIVSSPCRRERVLPERRC